MYNPFTLEDKTILLIGASSGIGQACAVECSKMRARVILVARRADRLSETFRELEGCGHEICVADITNAEDVNRLLKEVPVLNGVILCAGKGLTLPVLFNTRKKIDDVFEVNFFAQIELIRLLYKKKKLSFSSSVVAISSIAGSSVHNVGFSVYGASKAALSSYMKFCANEFAAQKIRVNTINPGMVNTEFLKGNVLSQEDFDKNMEQYPLKRYGEPCEIAYAAIYLLSDASSWMTGQNIVIDGGVSNA